MDMIGIGKFIAALRKQHGLTQEQLGEALGVTNKTVSRWETGMYLPPAEILLELSEMFDVSINEILSGERLTAEQYKQAAEQNLKQVLDVSAFSIKEKAEFYKKKWLREHIFEMCVCGIAIIALFVTGLVLRNGILSCSSVLLTFFAHCWRNNSMMAYVEKHIFDKTQTNSSAQKYPKQQQYSQT